jgi:hypothetical protein
MDTRSGSDSRSACHWGWAALRVWCAGCCLDYPIGRAAVSMPLLAVAVLADQEHSNMSDIPPGIEVVPTLVPARMINEFSYCPRLAYWSGCRANLRNRWTRSTVRVCTGAWISRRGICWRVRRLVQTVDVAAPLQLRNALFRRGSHRPDFRDGDVAAPLKRHHYGSVFERSETFPRRSHRGSIEADNRNTHLFVSFEIFATVFLKS